MSAILDEVKLSFSKAYELIKKYPEQMFMDLLKVNALGAAVSFAGLLVIGLIIYFLTGGDILKMGMEGYLSIVFIVAVTALISAAIGSVSYNVIQNTISNKKTNIFQHVSENLIPVVSLNIVLFLAMAIISIPMIASLAFGGLEAIFLICGATILSIIAFIAFVFLTQFSLLELVLQKNGVFESIMASADLVRKNIITIFILDIVISLISMAGSAGTSIFQSLFEIIPNMLAPFGLMATIAGYAIYFLLFYAVMILISTASQMLMIPMVYFFWKKAKG